MPGESTVTIFDNVMNVIGGACLVVASWFGFGD